MGTNNTAAHPDTIIALRNALNVQIALVETLRAECIALDADDSPLASMAEHDFVTELERRNEMADDLRLAEYGFRNTYPHPAARIHPSDAYSVALSSRGK